MEDIKDYKHTFSIDGTEVQLLINCIKGYWTSDVLKGNTGVGCCSGGAYKNLKEYIAKMEQQHRYGYYFHIASEGNRKYAKKNM